MPFLLFCFIGLTLLLPSRTTFLLSFMVHIMFSKGVIVGHTSHCGGIRVPTQEPTRVGPQQSSSVPGYPEYTVAYTLWRYRGAYTGTFLSMATTTRLSTWVPRVSVGYIYKLWRYAGACTGTYPSMATIIRFGTRVPNVFTFR